MVRNAHPGMVDTPGKKIGTKTWNGETTATETFNNLQQSTLTDPEAATEISCRPEQRRSCISVAIEAFHVFFMGLIPPTVCGEGLLPLKNRRYFLGKQSWLLTLMQQQRKADRMIHLRRVF